MQDAEYIIRLTTRELPLRFNPLFFCIVLFKMNQFFPISNFARRIENPVKRSEMKNFEKEINGFQLHLYSKTPSLITLFIKTSFSMSLRRLQGMGIVFKENFCYHFWELYVGKRGKFLAC